MAMIVLAGYSSIVVPVKAEAGCTHLYVQAEVINNTYTQQHGYSVGDDEYRNCVITTIKEEYVFICRLCGDKFTRTETTVTHSDCGL